MDALSYTKEKIICKKCGREYEANIIYIFGHRQSKDYCPECVQAEREAERIQEEAMKAAQIAKTRKEWRSYCGIPPLYMGKDFSNFDRTRGGNLKEIYQKCWDYAENLTYKGPYHSLLLYSDDVWGNGKTHLVTAIAHRILDKWNGEEIACPVMFTSEPEIYGKIQETYSFTQEERQKRPSEQQIINRMVGVRLLIIDDLGKQERRDMDFVRRTLFDIINRRYNQMRPVVITTNKNDKGLRDYLGKDEAILDRLIEMTEDNRVRVTGSSFRRKIT